jgi:hypothetical protein
MVVSRLMRFGLVGTLCCVLAMLAGVGCIGNTPNLCDGVTCDEGVCNPATGECVECLAAADCDDGNLCTTDTCMDNVCENTPVECEAGEVCNPEDGQCVEGVCFVDADCDDGDACTTDACVEGEGGMMECTNTAVECDNGMFCDGDETCDPATGECVDGELPCTDDQVCDEDNDVCVDVPDDECAVAADCDDGDACTDDACVTGPEGNLICENTEITCEDGFECVDGECVEIVDPCDGVVCDDGDSCTDDTCVDGACVFTEIVCDAGFECVDGECVAIPEDFMVEIAGCPDAALDAGASVELSASASNNVGGVTYAWAATNDATFQGGVNTGDTVTVIMGNAPTVVTVTATDDMGTTDGDTPEADDMTTTDDCSISIDISTLNVEAGSLAPARATLGAYDSLSVGEANNNAVNGSVSQAGYSQGDFIFAWTVDSQPGGSGSVSFDNPGEVDTGWRVNPPAAAGMYVFRLTATNAQTGDQDSDTVEVQFLNAPTVVVKDNFKPIVQNLIRSADSVGATYMLTYTFESDGTITIYDGTGTTNADIMLSQTVTAGENVDVEVVIPVGGDRLTTAQNLYQLTWIGTDLAGSTAVANLTDPTETAAKQRAAVYIGNMPTETTESSTVPKIDLNTDVGELAGNGVIIHNGIGSGDPDIANLARQTQIADINGDGYTDLCTLRSAANGVDVRFGSPELIRGDGAPAAGDDWGAVDINIDASANYVAFAIGDFENDGDNDVVTIDNTTANNAVQVFLLSGSGTGTAVTTASRTYTVPNANDLAGTNLALAGDVNGDGVDDIVVAMPEAEFDLSGGGDDDGIIGVIYGKASLPSSGNLWADAVTGESPAGTFNGERLRDTAAGADEWGTAAVIGQFNGSGGLDLWAAEGVGETDIRLYTGGNGSRMATAIQRELVQEAAADLQTNGIMRIGDVTGDGNADLVIGSPVKDKIYFVSNTASDQTALASVVAYVGTTTVNGAVWDFANNVSNDIELYDIDGDGNLDIIFGDEDGATGDRCLVIKGPVGLNNITQSDFYRSFVDGDDAVGTNIAFGDVNGDGLDDFIFGSATELYVICGTK